MAILELEVFSLSVRDEEKNISYKILKPAHPNLLEQTAQETPFPGMYPAANYKTFYKRNSRIYVISSNVCAWQAFPA